MVNRTIAAAIATLILPVTASATTMFPKKFVCPVGGETFTAQVIGSMSSWGQRPDGRRYGTTPIVPITECPGNGLVLFEEKFDDADLEKLTSLVNSTDYQSARKFETPHYRAWWLMDRMGRDPFDTAFTLLVATWEADGNAEKKRRYQRMFVESAAKLPWSEAKRSDWFWVNLRAANALREMGEFEASATLLEAIDKPERLPAEANQLKGARYLIDGLAMLNAEHNAALEPANLIPAHEAAQRCLDGASELTPAETKACADAKVAEQVERLKEYRKSSN
ncbi:MAG TPA: hypothetical protein VJM15_09820 [Sphingomicrobium sp.]|nr:hypothetical protein [Sphingomicrobium sp.]